MKKSALTMLKVSLLIALTLSIFLAADSQKILKRAPVNPEFLDYQNKEFSSVLGERNYGRRPNPVGKLVRSWPHREGLSRPLALPSSYDLRQLNRVPVIKDQGSCGSCWSFGAFASLESFLMPGEVRNFSNEHLVVNHGFDWGPCDGGNDYISQAYLSRWSGPIPESDLPYRSGATPAGTHSELIEKHVQQVVFLPERENYLDNNHIKQHVMSYGAVAFTYYAGNQYLNNATAGYYCNSDISPNHEVAIVGWDDNYPVSSFKTPPPGPGAFIAKNSWGTSFGENGFFYISYYDKTFCYPTSYNNAEPLTNYGTNYYYDELGWCSSYGYNTPVAWGANVFEAKNSLPIEAVGIITGDINTQCQIRVYKNSSRTNPASGLMVLQQTVVKTYPGYYTVKLNNPVAVNRGELFSVVVRYQDGGGYEYPVAVEYPWSNYSSQAVSHPGESFVSHDGSSWEDLYSEGANACIKAFSRYQGADMTVSVRKEALNSWMISKAAADIQVAISNLNAVSLAKIVIYRKSSPNEAYKLWKEVPAGQFSNGAYRCTDSFLESDGEYRYKIVALGSDGNVLASSGEQILR